MITYLLLVISLFLYIPRPTFAYTVSTALHRIKDYKERKMFDDLNLILFDQLLLFRDVAFVNFLV